MIFLLFLRHRRRKKKKNHFTRNARLQEDERVFSATRKFRHGKRIQSWNVHRSLHGRSCTLYLGLTPVLTLARLQEMATTVQARLTAL